MEKRRWNRWWYKVRIIAIRNQIFNERNEDRTEFSHFFQLIYCGFNNFFFLIIFFSCSRLMQPYLGSYSFGESNSSLHETQFFFLRSRLCEIVQHSSSECFFFLSPFSVGRIRGFNTEFKPNIQCAAAVNHLSTLVYNDCSGKYSNACIKESNRIA